MHESRLFRVTLFIIALVGMIFIAIEARSFLIPFVFSAFFSLMLLPIVGKVQKLVKNRIVAILLTLLTILLIIAAVIGGFAYELVDVMDNLGAIGKTIEKGILDLSNLITNIPLFSDIDLNAWITENIGKFIDKPISWIQKAVLGSTAFLGGFGVTLIYLFFLLLYATAFKRFLIVQSKPKFRDEFREVLSKIQTVSIKYLGGLFTVILILGVLNSLGLWIIGVDFALFWGLLAAMLVIIPYIGSILGGLLPFLYAIPTSDSWTTPILVVVLFVGIQALEGNFITPKIVGSSVSINPFMAIVALIIGSAVWGIPGMVLAIPLTAIVRIFFSEMDPMMPVAIMMGDDPVKNSREFETTYDHPRFSFWHWLTHGSK